jgi:hypothetical protein
MPSNEALKQQSANEPSKPELNQVPPNPLQFKQAPTTNPAQPVLATPVVPTPHQPSVPNVMPDQLKTDSQNITKTVEETHKVSIKHKASRHHHHKKSHADHNITAYSYSDKKANYNDVIIKDHSAKLVTTHGYHIVTGELQSKRKSSVPKDS